MPEINPTLAAMIATAVVVLLVAFGAVRAVLAAKNAEPDVLRKLTVAPAQLLGLPAGRLQVGAAADLVLFELNRPWKITEAGLHSLSKNSAFEGRLVEGRVVRTLVDGRTVYLHESR